MAGSGYLRISALAAAIACGLSIGEAAAAELPRGAADGVRVSERIAKWFGWLAAQPSEGWRVESLMVESPLEFSLTQAGDLGPDEFGGWLVGLRSLHPKVEFRLGRLRFDPVDDDLLRVRFELDRHAVDAAGLPHLARSEQTWLIRELPGEAPVVLRIEEQRLLAFPGTGPQIVCY
jgi:hypothetical protein